MDMEFEQEEYGTIKSSAPVSVLRQISTASNPVRARDSEGSSGVHQPSSRNPVSVVTTHIACDGCRVSGSDCIRQSYGSQCVACLHLNEPCVFEGGSTILNDRGVSAKESVVAASSSRLGSGMKCKLCGTKSTPLWRRSLSGVGHICNACGVRERNQRRRKEDVVLREENLAPEEFAPPKRKRGRPPNPRPAPQPDLVAPTHHKSTSLWTRPPTTPEMLKDERQRLGIPSSSLNCHIPNCPTPVQKSSTALSNHLRACHSEGEFKFPDKEEVMVYRDPDGWLRCPRCNLGYRRLDGLASHCAEHSRYMTVEAMEDFQTVDSLFEESLGSGMRCNLCNIVETNPVLLRNHFFRHSDVTLDGLVFKRDINGLLRCVCGSYGQKHMQELKNHLSKCGVVLDKKRALKSPEVLVPKLDRFEFDDIGDLALSDARPEQETGIFYNSLIRGVMPSYDLASTHVRSAIKQMSAMHLRSLIPNFDSCKVSLGDAKEATFLVPEDACDAFVEWIIPKLEECQLSRRAEMEFIDFTP
ncbi:hypothetical protein BC830DRAFT_1130738 [Chytriomyces sp. MP71]|nr:hypothetical protein BC830DRAFT_1130738 [Chytriomyces sp. MP71]